MRNIIFEKVGMKNFGPYIEPLEYLIKDKSLTLITGANGIGKTMSLDAIPYTLYGITSKGARGDDVVNNTIEKQCHTWVEFRIENDKYSINRYHKYSKYGGNTVLLSKNGEPPYKKGQKEVLPEIERLILPRQLFMNTIMFGQKVKDFFTDLGDSDRKEIFRKVLKLEDYVFYYNNAKNKLDQITTEIEKFKNKIIVNNSLKTDAEDQIKTQNILSKEFIKNNQDQISELEKKKQVSNTILNNWIDSICKLKEKDIDLESILTQIATINNELKNIDSVLQNEKQKIHSQSIVKILDMKEQANKLQNEIVNDFKKILEFFQKGKSDEEKKLNDNHLLILNKKSKIRETIITFDSKKNSLNESLSEMSESIINSTVSVCPTCKQEITQKTKERLLQKQQNLKNQISTLIDDIGIKKEEEIKIDQELSEFLQKYNNIIQEYDLKIDQCKKEEKEKIIHCQNKLNSSLNQIQDIVEKMEKKVEKAFDNKTLMMKENLQNLQNKKESIEYTIKDIQTQEITIQNIKNEINQINQSIQFIQESEFDKTILNGANKRIIDLVQQLILINKDIFNLEKFYKICVFWKEAFSSKGIPSMLIDESIPFMNERVSYYLDKISNGRYIVSFDTLDETKSGEFRDKISVKIIDTETKANKRVQLSGGQTRLIDISTILTLGDLQSKVQETTFNILLFDEIFDTLDDMNVEFVSKILRLLTTDKSIFIISHKHVDHLEADDIYNLK